MCHTKSGVFALDNICSHAYARMSEGRLRGTRLICPLHGASFDVRDGRVLGPPATQPLAATRTRRAMAWSKWRLAAATACRVIVTQRRWSKRRPTRAAAMFTFWMSIAPPAMPQPQASRRRRSIGNSFE